MGDVFSQIMVSWFALILQCDITVSCENRNISLRFPVISPVSRSSPFLRQCASRR